jgi:hypothetical protein
MYRRERGSEEEDIVLPEGVNIDGNVSVGVAVRSTCA